MENIQMPKRKGGKGLVFLILIIIIIIVLYLLKPELFDFVKKLFTGGQ